MAKKADVNIELSIDKLIKSMAKFVKEAQETCDMLKKLKEVQNGKSKSKSIL